MKDSENHFSGGKKKVLSVFKFQTAVMWKKKKKKKQIYAM